VNKRPSLFSPIIFSGEARTRSRTLLSPRRRRDPRPLPEPNRLDHRRLGGGNVFGRVQLAEQHDGSRRPQRCHPPEHGRSGRVRLDGQLESGKKNGANCFCQLATLPNS